MCRKSAGVGGERAHGPAMWRIGYGMSVLGSLDFPKSAWKNYKLILLTPQVPNVRFDPVSMEVNLIC